MIPFVRWDSVPYGVAEPVSPLIRRVTANNPGPFTFKGTGTYVIGRGSVAVIDPGPDDNDHLLALLAGLEGESVSHILVTHTHIDHSPLSRALSAHTGARVYAFGPNPSTPDGTGEAGGEGDLDAETAQAVDELLGSRDRPEALGGDFLRLSASGVLRREKGVELGRAVVDDGRARQVEDDQLEVDQVVVVVQLIALPGGLGGDIVEAVVVERVVAVIQVVVIVVPVAAPRPGERADRRSVVELARDEAVGGHRGAFLRGSAGVCGENRDRDSDRGDSVGGRFDRGRNSG